MGVYGPSSFALLLVDGYDLLPAKPATVTEEDEAITERSDGLGDAAEEATPIGKRRYVLTQGGAFFSDLANGLHTAMQGQGAASRIVCVGFDGNTANQHFLGYEGVYAHKYAAIGTREGLTKANVTYMVSGSRDKGVILHALEAETADEDTEASSQDHTLDTHQQVVPITSSSVANPSIITTPGNHQLTDGQTVLIAGHTGSTPDINGEHVVTVISATTFSIPVNVTVGGTGGTLVQANTVGGAVGYLQVTNLTLGGYTDITVRVRDSADDAVFADLVTFTNVSATPAKERVVVAGTIDRYLAYSLAYNGAGSGASARFMAGLART